VFNVCEKYKQKKDYFAPLFAEIAAGGIAAMMHDLLSFDLKDWHPRDNVPDNAALHEQKMLSLSPDDQWWFDLLQSGELPREVHANAERDELAHPLWATSASLFQHARETVPRLKDKSDHALSDILKKYKCNRDQNHRIVGLRAWEFPPLAEARAAWDAETGTKTQWLGEEWKRAPW
jgi:hypothetical protein